MLFMAVFFWAGFAIENRKFQSKDPVNAADCTPDSNLVNPCRPWLGAAVDKYPQVASDRRSQTEYHEQRMGRKLDIVHTYNPVGNNTLSSHDIYFAKRSGTILFKNWKPTNNWSTASGGNAAVNATIDTMANSVKSLGSTKIFLTVHHEAENDVSGGANGCSSTMNYVGSAGTPADYRAMWRNVYNRFNNLGVTNVVWVIDYMNYSPWDCLIDDMYPGNDIVDWVMFNAYGSQGPNNNNYSNKVRHFYDLLTRTNSSTHDYLSKPWGIVEWNIRNASAAEQYSYYDQAKASLEKNEFPKLKAHMVFDSIGPEGNENRVAYRDGGIFDAVKQEHYKAFANSHVFSAASGPSPAPPPPSDTISPTASLTSPSNGATVSGQVTVSANASDNTGVVKVDFTIDGNVIATDTSAPYSAVWDTRQVPNGDHIVRAKAYDAAGNTKTPQITVKVNNTASAPLPPSIRSYAASPSTVAVGAKTTLTWSTSNTASCSVSPNGPQNSTQTSWLTPAYTSSGAKKYTLTCKNSAGQTVSAELTVTVNAPVAPPVKPSLSADKSTVAQGANVLLSWSSVGATQCTLSPGNIIAAGSSASKLVSNLGQTTTYKVECSNSAGKTTSDALTVRVVASGQTVPLAVPSVTSFTAEPSSLPAPGVSTLKWHTSNIATNGCAISPGVLTSTSASGQWITPLISQSTTFVLTCSDYAGKTVNASVDVIVAGQPAAANTSKPKNIPRVASEPVLKASNGLSIINAQLRDSVKRGEYVTLDPGNVVDEEKIKNIARIEYYDGEKLLQTVLAPPYAFSTKDMPTGTFTITERVYYHDGSQSELTQNITILDAANVSSRIPASAQKILVGVGVGFVVALAGAALSYKWWLPRLRTHWNWLDRFLISRGVGGGPGDGPTTPAGSNWPGYPY